MSNDLTVKNEEMLTMRAFLEQPNIKAYIENLLKDDAGTFGASLVTLVQGDRKLQECKKLSILMCGLKAAALKLPLENNLGYAYAIPYGNEAQFQLGYKAFVQLALRTNQFLRLNVEAIKEGELISYDPLTEIIKYKFIENRESKDLPTIGFCAFFKLTNGFEKLLYRRIEDILAHGKRFSKAFGRKDAPWQTDTEAMCKKTLLKELLSKWAPLSTEVLDAVRADQAVIRDVSGVYEYPDREIAPSQPATNYGIPEDTLSELHALMDELGMNEAEKAMRLGATRGFPETVKGLYDNCVYLVEQKRKGEETK